MIGIGTIWRPIAQAMMVHSWPSKHHWKTWRKLSKTDYEGRENSSKSNFSRAWKICKITWNSRCKPAKDISVRWWNKTANRALLPPTISTASGSWLNCPNRWYWPGSCITARIHAKNIFRGRNRHTTRWRKTLSGRMVPWMWPSLRAGSTKWRLACTMRRSWRKQSHIWCWMGNISDCWASENPQPTATPRQKA